MSGWKYLHDDDEDEDAMEIRNKRVFVIVSTKRKYISNELFALLKKKLSSSILIIFPQETIKFVMFYHPSNEILNKIRIIK